jgi:hypothetical protein
VKSPNEIEESSIFSEKIIFKALIFQFDILFSNVSIILIFGLVESIVKLSEFWKELFPALSVPVILILALLVSIDGIVFQIYVPLFAILSTIRLYVEPSKYSNLIGVPVNPETLSVIFPGVQLTVILSHQENITHDNGEVIVLVPIVGPVVSFVMVIL